MINKKLLSFLIIISMYAYSDSLLENYYQEPQNIQSSSSLLDRNYTVNKVFNNINQVSDNLNNLGIVSTVKDKQYRSPVMVEIKSNTNIKDFINLAANKFGYTWSQQGGTIIFSATNPIVTTQVASQTSQITKISGVSVNEVWSYSASDKYISVTFARWAKQAGYQLVWKAENDFEVQSSGSLNVGFKSAVNEVLKSFKNSENPLKAEWYKNNVVVISNFGN